MTMRIRLTALLTVLLLCALIAADALAIGSPAPATTIVASASAGSFCGDSQERAFLGLINAYRSQNHLATLSFSRALGAASKFHSTDMAQGNYFNHYLTRAGINWTTNVRNYGYTGSSLAENIAAGESSAQETFIQWKNSPEHNANMLSATYKAIGIGRAFTRTSTYNWYWTTDFGNKVDATAPACSPEPVYVAASKSSANYCADAEETAFLKQLNAYRATKNLPAIVMDQRLAAAAAFHSADMAKVNRFSTNLTSTTWRNNIYDFGYDDPNAVSAASGSGSASSIFGAFSKGSMSASSTLVVGIGRTKSSGSSLYYWVVYYGGFLDQKLSCAAQASVASQTDAKTPTKTATKTATKTGTATKTPTKTATETATAVPTATAAKTATATGTSTSVATPADTSTTVPTATETETPAPSETATETPTPTEMSTETSTPTQMSTDTPEPDQSAADELSQTPNP